MNNLIIIYLFLIITCGYCKQANKLFGGNTIMVNCYPFLVSIRFAGEHICSGSIINPSYIVTTASCVTSDKNIIYGNLQIFSRTKNIYDHDDGNINDVALVIIHSDYSPRQFWANDISLLKLSKELSLNLYNGYITLPVTSNIYDTSLILWLIGWEKFDQSHKLQLSTLIIKLLPMKNCIALLGQFGKINSAQRCNEPSLHMRNIDYGDGGSPVLSYNREVLFGMVSLISPNPSDPVVLTKVMNYYTGWIIKMLDKY